MKPADTFLCKMFGKSKDKDQKVIKFQRIHFKLRIQKISEIDYINLKRCTMKQKS